MANYKTVTFSLPPPTSADDNPTTSDNFLNPLLALDRTLRASFSHLANKLFKVVWKDGSHEILRITRDCGQDCFVVNYPPALPRVHRVPVSEPSQRSSDAAGTEEAANSDNVTFTIPVQDPLTDARSFLSDIEFAEPFMKLDSILRKTFPMLCNLRFYIKYSDYLGEFVVISREVPDDLYIMTRLGLELNAESSANAPERNATVVDDISMVPPSVVHLNCTFGQEFNDNTFVKERSGPKGEAVTFVTNYPFLASFLSMEKQLPRSISQLSIKWKVGPTSYVIISRWNQKDVLIIVKPPLSEDSEFETEEEFDDATPNDIRAPEGMIKLVDDPTLKVVTISVPLTAFSGAGGISISLKKIGAGRRSHSEPDVED